MTSTAPALAARRRDVRVIGLIGVGHGFSHFYQLALPPLFLIMNRDMGYSFTQLGLLTAVFFVVSGAAQAPMGFLVDRFGARAFLVAGLGLEAGATLFYGVFPDFWSLLLLSALAGLGNSVFHPVDFSILNATVDPARMGRAFGVHSITGFIGYAAAPATMVLLAQAFGWREALIAVGGAGLVFLLVFAAFSSDFRDSAGEKARAGEPLPLAQGIRLLMQIPFLMYLLFFTLLSFALVALQTQAPSSLNSLYGMSVTHSTAVLNALLIGCPVGAVLGGILADRSDRHEAITTACLLLAAAFVALGALTAAPGNAMMAAFFLAGVFFGGFFPARDMLVRRTTPPGSSGMVFGFVYSGLDLGSAVAPPICGWFVDQGRAEWTFIGVSAALAVCVLTVYGARLGGPVRGLEASQAL